MKSKKYEVIFLVILFVILFRIIFLVPNEMVAKNVGKLIINEIMSSNEKTISDKFGKYSDYIEIYNGYDVDIDLTGYFLSDDSNETKKWMFPTCTIKAKSYLLIFASGKNTVEDGEIHTNFKLDSKGESVILSNDKGDVISKIYSNIYLKDTSYGFNGNDYVYYYEGTPGLENNGDYSKNVITVKKQESKESVNNIKTDVIINEVSVINDEAIELYNKSNDNINLMGYAIGDKSGYKYNFDNIIIPSNSYLVVYASDDKEGLINNKLYIKTGLNNTNEEIYLYKDNNIVDKFLVKKAIANVSIGIDENNTVKYFKNITLGKKNSNDIYLGYAMEPIFSKEGGYVKDKYDLILSSVDGSDIYYTLDGSFPSNKSIKYNGKIEINKTTNVKAIAYKDGYIASDIVSRTFFVNDTHDISIISLTSNNDYLFGSKGLITNYTSKALKKISFEYYDSNGNFGTGFIGDAKLSGNLGGSRDKAQRGMTVYLRKNYGLNTISYPFFDSNQTLYSSLLLRNGGEDYLKIHLFDAALQVALKGQMDLDMQDYRPVVLYINGQYFGIYNLRDKLNSDYVKNKYNVESSQIDLIKYSTPTVGSKTDYDNLINYVRSHNLKDKEAYNYVKSQVDIQELINYWIVQSYYGNSDLGNIKYYKTENGKWRFMLYDIDWSLYYIKKSISFPVLNEKISAATYVKSTIDLSRKLYQNEEYKDLYLTSLSKYLKTTFNPEHMNEVIDNLVLELEKEMPRHIDRWKDTNSSLESMNVWHSNIQRFKNKLKDRYDYVVGCLKDSFKLTNDEYEKYFGDLK